MRYEIKKQLISQTQVPENCDEAIFIWLFTSTDSKG